MFNKRNIIVSYTIFLFIFVLFIYLSYIEKDNSDILTENSYSVFIDNEYQTFRDKNGRKLHVIEENGQLYLPLSGIGDYLNYIVEVKGNEIILHDTGVEGSLLDIKTSDISTETLFSNDDIYSYNRTVFIVWTSWCPDCDVLLKGISENYSEFEENGIQLVGIPIFSDEDGKEEAISKIKEYNLLFKNILVTDEINSNLLTNLENIPAIYVVDNKGRILGKSEETNILYEDIIKLLDIVQDCNEC